MIQWMRDNPIKVLGLVVLFVVLYWMMSSNSGSTTVSTSPGYDAGTVQAGMQLQAAQMQQQGQLAALQVSANAQSDQTAAAIAIATLQAQTVREQNVLGAEVAGHSLDVQYMIANSANSLQGAITASNNATAMQIASMTQATNQLVISAGTEQARINANVMNTQITSNAGVLNNQTSANASVAKGAQKAGMFDRLIKGPCFVTTACCAVMNLPDDCFELVQLRRLRDEYVSTLPDGNQLFTDYCVLSPVLIAAVDARADAGEVWANIHRLYIRPAAEHVVAGRMVQAFERYCVMLDDLKHMAGLTGNSSNG